jgi:hypothetical protein
MTFVSCLQGGDRRSADTAEATVRPRECAERQLIGAIGSQIVKSGENSH